MEVPNVDVKHLLSLPGRAYPSSAMPGQADPGLCRPNPAKPSVRLPLQL